MIPEHYLFDTFRGKRLQLGVTGSIAAYKALELTRVFTSMSIQVGVTLSPGAHQFVTDFSFGAVGADPIHTKLFNPEEHFGHLEPAVADAFLIAPASANLLAKVAHGLADDILSCQLLAYTGPILAAPAMNPNMWNAKSTQANWQTLLQRGVRGIGPACGTVACGDTGAGKMSGIDEIFIHTLRALAPQDMAGLKVMVTLGPTREYFDRARFWSNPSTGLMGTALAISAALRGADVTAIHGPISLAMPDFIRTVPVTSAREMFEAAKDYFPAQDIGCFTAAVADFRPPECPQAKFKKDGEGLSLNFEQNPDILATLSTSKKVGQKTIGFAAEAENLRENARRKLEEKNLDLLVANPIGEEGAGFAASTNRVTVFDRAGREDHWPQMKKTEIAWRIWDWISASTE